mmetsp:Transcript_18922/g.44915  ORF Transcript_18922/g.44915 Transcript_18922/m.44915 type:complete len:214 (-) Transcript_18922:3-644(-)
MYPHVEESNVPHTTIKEEDCHCRQDEYRCHIHHWNFPLHFPPGAHDKEALRSCKGEMGPLEPMQDGFNDHQGAQHQCYEASEAVAWKTRCPHLAKSRSSGGTRPVYTKKCGWIPAVGLFGVRARHNTKLDRLLQGLVQFFPTCEAAADPRCQHDEREMRDYDEASAKVSENGNAILQVLVWPGSRRFSPNTAAFEWHMSFIGWPDLGEAVLQA